MTLLEINSLYAYYGSVPALRDFSLSIDEGEAVGLGGANGAGKSTLLKAVIGMVATRGTVNFAGRGIDNHSTTRRIRAGIVYVPQERMVVGGISVLENMRLFWLAGDRHLSFPDSVARVFESFPELVDRKANPASSLSGGERQMLALSRVLLTSEPRLLLLDEPSAGLAPIVVNRIAELIDGWRHQGLTFLLLEQNERLLDRCCERRLKLASGELVRGPAGASGAEGEQKTSL